MEREPGVRHRGALMAALPLALLAGAGSVGAQKPAMSGLVRQAQGGAPMECLHVALLDSADRAVAHTVTDSAGMFVIVAPDTGAYRVQFSLPGYPEMEGPLVRLSAGMMTEQEYPVSFDNLISGLLEEPSRRKKSEQVDLADWHSAEPMGSGRVLGRRVPLGSVSSANMMLVSSEQIAAQYVIDTTGHVRASSWRTVVVSDPNAMQRARLVLTSEHFRPARIGQQPVCQLIMGEFKSQMLRGSPLR
jgi:hypothetical protein